MCFLEKIEAKTNKPDERRQNAQENQDSPFFHTNPSLLLDALLHTQNNGDTGHGRKRQYTKGDPDCCGHGAQELNQGEGHIAQDAAIGSGEHPGKQQGAEEIDHPEKEQAFVSKLGPERAQEHNNDDQRKDRQGDIGAFQEGKVSIIGNTREQ